MSLIPLILLVAFPLWFLIFVVFKDSSRPDVPPDHRASPVAEPQASGAGTDVASPGWTALDDYQLTRLLKGSASS